MLFQPAIIALLLASAVCVAAMTAAAPFALEVIRRWDIASGSELQLALERRTYLFSTLLAFVLSTQLAALLLFVFNADKMSVMFVGAMCAVGTLNVNPYGFPALMAQMLVFFLSAACLEINHVDNRAPDYPLVRIKYALLIALLPLLALSFALQLQYFLGLKADVITSCCGSLFSSEAKTIASEASGMPPVPAMALFYGALALAILAAGRQAVRKSGGTLTAATGVAAFAAGITGVLSFVSLYVYEHPHHHCPFCILKAEYDFQGYWLYLPLFAATAAAIGAGAVQPFARVASLRDVVPVVSARLAAIAAAGFALFAIIATFMVLRSNLILIEH